MGDLSEPRRPMEGPVTPCPVCTRERHHVFRAVVLRRHEADYVLCNACGLLQAHAPYWLDEAYGSALSDIDTGLVTRNQRVAKALNGLYAAWFHPSDRFVDLAGGSGLLVRMLRDFGHDAYWLDPYATNQFARGFAAPAGRYAAASAIEAMEHVEDPVTLVEAAFGDFGARAFVFTQELYEGPPDPGWWYLQLETGQHITFYRRRTLLSLAERFDARLYSRGWLHVLVRDDQQLPTWPFTAASSNRGAAFLARWGRRRRTSLTGTDSAARKEALRDAGVDRADVP